MPTAEELLVQIRSEGVGETQQDLEGVESAMEDTAESAGDSAEELQGFSEQFAGAMTAAVAALAVGAAGLLSQVPVLGEAFAGLGAIVDAVAFQMDGVLRPVLTPLTNLFFDIADGIFSAEGAAGDLVGILGTITSVGAILIPLVARIGVVFGQWSSTLAGVQSILGTLASGISSIASTIAGFISGSLAAAAAIGTLLGLLGVAALEVSGVLDIFRNFGQVVGRGVPNAIVNAWLALMSPFIGVLTVIGAAINGFVSGFLEGGLSEGIDRAVSNVQRALSLFANAWSQTLGNIADGITGFVNNASSAIGGVIEDVLDVVSDLIDEAFDIGADIAESIVDGISENLDVGGVGGGGVGGGLELPDLSLGAGVGTSQVVRGNAGGGGGGGGNGGGGGIDIQLDGRSIIEDTGRFITGASNRRGL